MDDVTIRPATKADADGLADLMAAAEAVDRTGEHYSVDDLVEELANPAVELDRDWLVAEADGELVAHVRLLPRAPVDGEMDVTVEGTVHPAWRRRGLASTLVPRMVERARAHVAERGADLRPVIRAQALSEDADLASVLARAGFRPVRWTFVMEADLHVLPDSDEDADEGLPPGYTLGTWAGVPDDELRTAHNTAFVGHPGWTAWSPEMWEQWVSGSRNHRPALSLLARDGSGAVAAYVQTCEYDAVQAATGVREAVAAKVGTLPEHRGRGLASALLRTAMRRWAADGFDRAALDVDSENPSGANAIYERVGFVVTTRFTDHLLGA